LDYLIEVQSAEQVFYKAHGRYGQLAEVDLDSQTRIAFSNGFKGYRLDARITPATFVITAQPLPEGGAHDSFCVDNAGMIRLVHSDAGQCAPAGC
jgi:hypothetical protein